MEKIERVEGCAAPLLRINIDSEQLCPAASHSKLPAGEIGKALFANWRYNKDGSPNAGFILNQPPYDHAQILLGDRNFGCGSSGEHGHHAIRSFGIRCLIAPTFAGIFYTNCFSNGILPVELPIENVRLLADQMETSGGSARVAVDLVKQEVKAPGGETFHFKTPVLLRRMMLEGLDELGLTLTMQSEIDQFWKQDHVKRPWIHQIGT